ncbi:ribbon-helix-helix domain-containing protein [Acidianus sp. HS-5]|uniref:ribbon-helix-helix domain-containing protein n=1 Tax=Acidianus sp. HS-5 TaxID=2886040 RepID=UPI001F48820E|nr:ribbon-helix-helix domain-containing protein [Acidianus sp. HS-5]BDC19832.1 hypothetical protein HS5_27220 [Acidianus sp. HS-5]
MKIITVKVPEELYEKMRKHKEINWSEIIRNAIREELEKVENTSTGSEIIDKLRQLGINENDISIESPQGEEEFQKELKRKSTIQTL